MKKNHKNFPFVYYFLFLSQVSLIYLKIQSPEKSMINLLIAGDKKDLQKSTQHHQEIKHQPVKQYPQQPQQQPIHLVDNNSFINDYNYDDDYNGVVYDFNHYHRRD